MSPLWSLHRFDGVDAHPRAAVPKPWVGFSSVLLDLLTFTPAALLPGTGLCVT